MRGKVFGTDAGGFGTATCPVCGGSLPEAAELRCSRCLDSAAVSRHRLRELERTGRDYLCGQCRRVDSIVLTDAERARYLRWWRERFTEDELVRMASAIWPP